MNSLENFKIVQADISNLNDIEKIEQNLKIRNLSFVSLENDLKSDTNVYFMALQNGKVLGYVALELLYDHIDITSIAVDKDYRQMGIATLLLNKVVSIYTKKKYNSIFLEVRVSNLPAIRLYEKLGFKKISTRSNYYKIKDLTEDAYVYKKDLA